MFRKVLLNLCLIFLPTQLGYHFWPSYSYVAGFRIDYLSPIIYLVDIFLVLYVLLSLGKIINFLYKYKKPLLAGLIIVFFNLLFSISPLNTIIWYLHLILYLTFALSVRINNITLSDILKPLLLSTSIVVVIEILQFIKQGSLGGIFYWMGERTFSVSTPNVAKIELFGREILRPYSVFSHPNSLAGYLLLIVLLIKKSGKNQIFIPLFVSGIALTFSKSTIICLLIFFINTPYQIILLLSVINTLIPLLAFEEITKSLPSYITSRIYYAKNTITMIRNYPLFGVGYGNHIQALSDNIPLRNISQSGLQPVHNYFLLLVSEFGIAPLSVVFFFLKRMVNKTLNQKTLRYLAIVILLATFDHYFYTLPQNKLLLLIYIVYIV